MRPNSNSTFDCHDPKQIRLKTRLRLDHVTSININSNTVFKIALILPLIPNMKLRQLLLGSPSYANERRTLLDKIRSINSCILQENDTIITKDLFFGNISLNKTSNTLISNARIDYLISTQGLAVSDDGAIK